MVGGDKEEKQLPVARGEDVEFSMEQADEDDREALERAEAADSRAQGNQELQVTSALGTALSGVVPTRHDEDTSLIFRSDQAGVLKDGGGI